MSRCVSVVIQKYNVKTLTTKRPTGTSEGTTPGTEKVELRQEQQPRTMHDSMDGGGRTALGDLQGRRKLGQRRERLPKQRSRSNCRDGGNATDCQEQS